MTCPYFWFAVYYRIFFVSKNSFQFLTRDNLNLLKTSLCDVTKGADTSHVFYLSKWKVQQHICFTVSKPVCLCMRL